MKSLAQILDQLTRLDRLNSVLQVRQRAKAIDGNFFDVIKKNIDVLPGGAPSGRSNKVSSYLYQSVDGFRVYIGRQAAEADEVPREGKCLLGCLVRRRGESCSPHE